ncbi:hypothetical protein FRB99_003211 [Tulasnella sp. 403]|nr:hypothetical protein FRB99_003211 [Tulasnella sp. 403]
MVGPITSSLLSQNWRTKQAPFIALAITFLLLRSRILPKRLPKLDLARKNLSPKEFNEALQRLYYDEEDGSKRILVPHRGGISEVRITPTPADRFAQDAKYYPPLPTSHKPNVDKSFLKQLSAILRIVFPSWKSKQVAIVALHSAFLILRTLLSVAVARLDGKIVRALVSADAKGFMRGLGLWFALAVPSTYTNSMLRHLQSKLALRLRTQLSRYTHDLYLSSAPELRYYRVGSEAGLDSVDQYITTDIAAFCESLSALYGNMMKPMLDMFIFTAQLSRSLGFFGTVLLFGNYFATASILRSVTPAFGKLAAVEARLEGEYRAGVARVGREAEEVAFYNGGLRERDILWRAYLKLIKHVNSIYKIRIAYEWTEDYVIKYMWSAAGYLLISIPVMMNRKQHVGVQTRPETVVEGVVDNAVARRTEDYIANRRLLLSLADAGGRVMYAYKDLLELAGLTTRIYTMLSSLHNLPPLPAFKENERGERIVMEGVGIKPPKSNEELVRQLDLKIEKGEHVMITGPNGVGKTAIARVLAGLWAGDGGEAIERPERGVKGVFVVPQRAYMVVGTLRDQIIYPHSYTQFEASGKTDADLIRILNVVHLAYLPGREGGWETRKEWKDVLSGGEKQRMGMARLFYHQPKFAILDECTSAVSTDVEGLMYQYAKDIGITLITISHRPSLTKYHKRLLTLTGEGGGRWYETSIGTEEERMGIENEIAVLEARLQEVEGWEKRLKEVADELGVPVGKLGKSAVDFNTTALNHLMSPNYPEQDLDFINRLPPELLICVFLDILALLDGADRFRFPFKLAGVSRRWRQLCLATPYLWTYTFHGGRRANDKFIALQVRRSAGLPLDVSMRWYDLDDEKKAHRIIGSLAERVKWVTFGGSSSTFSRLRYSECLTTMSSLLEDVELHPSDRTPVTSFLWQHPCCPQLKRLCLRAEDPRLELSWSSFSYEKLTVLALHNCTVSMEKIGLFFQEMPQIEALQLFCVFANDHDRLASAIVAPCLRRLCAVSESRQMAYTRCWAMKLIQALEAPELRELMYGVLYSFMVGVHITHSEENWGAKFPKLDAFGLCGVWLEDEELKKMLRLTSTGVRKLTILNTTGYVANHVNVLMQLVEQGELMRLEGVDLRSVRVRSVYEGLKGRKTRLPLRIRVDRDGLVKDDDDDDLVARVNKIVQLEVCDHDKFKEWIY